MSFVAWILIGLAAGFTGSRLSNRSTDRILPDVFLGVAGALTGGWLCYTFGPPGVNGLNILSLLAAGVGSLTFLLIYQAFRRL